MPETNMNNELSKYMMNFKITLHPYMYVNQNISNHFLILVLLERVFFRVGSAATDVQLSSCISNFLVPVLQKLASPHESVRNKVSGNKIKIIIL